jgi:uncharacterized membrane protein YwzB
VKRSRVVSEIVFRVLCDTNLSHGVVVFWGLQSVLYDKHEPWTFLHQQICNVIFVNFEMLFDLGIFLLRSIKVSIRNRMPGKKVILLYVKCVYHGGKEFFSIFRYQVIFFQPAKSVSNNIFGSFDVA